MNRARANGLRACAFLLLGAIAGAGIGAARADTPRDWKPQLPLDINYGGWFQVGFATEQWPFAFLQQENRLQLNQAWFYLERQADGSKGVDWGFRFDAMYGVDGYETQSFGNNPGRWDFLNGFDHGEYAWAIPQLYGEIAMGDLSIKAGHFYTLIGYEVVTAPDNFFYSHSYTMFNSEPFTHTGVLATYQASDQVTLYGGWTLGWDTGFDQLDGGSNFLGGVQWQPDQNTTLTYMTTIGDFGWRGEGYSHSIVLSLLCGEDWRFVTQSDLLSVENFGIQQDQFGLIQYAFYRLNETVELGGRVEWWRSDNGFGTDNFYQATLGANIKPAENVIIRPEIRYDWFADTTGLRDHATFATDLILTY